MQSQSRVYIVYKMLNQQLHTFSFKAVRHSQQQVGQFVVAMLFIESDQESLESSIIICDRNWLKLTRKSRAELEVGQAAM